jgi:hypothetical protein
MSWVKKTTNDQIPEHLEMMFYTRYARTVIGTRIGAKIKCGVQDIDIEDVTHFQNKPEPPHKELLDA